MLETSHPDAAHVSPLSPAAGAQARGCLPEAQGHVICYCPVSSGKGRADWLATPSFHRRDSKSGVFIPALQADIRSPEDFPQPPGLQL